MSKMTRETWVPFGMLITAVLAAGYVARSYAKVEVGVTGNTQATVKQAQDLDELRVELRNEIATIADQVQWIRDAVIRIEASLNTRPIRHAMPGG